MTSLKLTDKRPATCVMDLKSIRLREETSAPEIVEISEKDGFFLNTAFTSDFRIRKPIYEMMKKAQSALPEGCYFMIYEAYRPLKRQIDLWNRATVFLKSEYPDASESYLRDLTETFVADPFNGIGSGHQAACAMDITLCDKDGNEYPMGTKCQEIQENTPTMSQGISPEVRKNRNTLLKALEGTGLINYPEEWWHYSYGDHSWAILKGEKEAIYGPLNI